ncbi:multidrug resistance efflux transporter family protein [Bacillus atrophaeus]|uniref:DMT family transporter n=1 Tax=Bacillus atrophaeus TaxID=1452 RepID=UPI00032D996E|nr:multidrug resistance efflux transporter family protein [Bacillus atrophaeus]AKL83977.1 YjlA [Bacillus atrophaeus UCMB-5137]MCY9203591.1 multidrug resistance efflux transporter family protein [Bacillus atrophaeus]MDQ0927091.1 drug/metabolite transporter (DMT)-like permease [Bacillus atrophaeus]MDS9997985.1 multidrug resistance efflux transporter family protein [Bacillus atrophaeus]MEC0885716.1 multidrug resistance efflux transporter family protein [Bacillus atrophaeus]
MKAILVGILASLFFAVTFVLNRAMELSGGSWYWSASLRFIFMVPFLLFIVMMRGKLTPLLKEMRKHPLFWLKWSFVGFVLFYAPITFAAAFGPGWLVAGTWQITIVAGVLLSPFFYETKDLPGGPQLVRQKIPLAALMTSFIILLGAGIIQLQHAESLSAKMLLFSVLPVVIAAFAYPLGNRKMLVKYGGKLDTFQRVLGMTLASLPFWLLLAAYGWWSDGLPSMGQTVQSFIVAVSSGIVATVLFFWATDMVRDHPQKLAAVEATQSGEVIFALLGEMILLSGAFPSLLSFSGLLFIITGMILHTFASRQRIPKAAAKEKAQSI